MKRLLLSNLIGLTFLMSCKKDYSCECQVNGVQSVYLINNQTKIKASEMCNEYAQELMLTSGGAAGSCLFVEPN